MNVPTMKFKMPEKHLELGVMVEQGFAFGIGDEDGEDAVVVVGLHDAAIRPEKREMALRLEFVLNQGSEVAHGISPVIGQSGKREPGRGSRTGTSSETLDEFRNAR